MNILTYFYKKPLNFVRKFTACEIPLRYIFSNVWFVHPVGVVIGKRVEIGKNVQIYSCVTIGRKGMDRDKPMPVIEDNVIIYTGAKVLGNITVGEGAIIGANAVVIHDVPKNSIVVGVPGRIKKK